MNILLLFLFPILGYLCGSFLFSIWFTRYVKNVDVRDVGSGHETTTNTIHHGARASFFTGILVAPVFWLVNLRGMEFQIAIAGGLVIAYRFLIDWNRKYRELWLDREKQ